MDHLKSFPYNDILESESIDFPCNQKGRWAVCLRTTFPIHALAYDLIAAEKLLLSACPYWCLTKFLFQDFSARLSFLWTKFY